MIVNQPGRIAHGLHLLGSGVMPMYLVEAPLPVIIDTGFSFLADSYSENIRRLLGDRGPSLCLLTHSHFDHVGGAGGLKRRFPDMAVGASALAAEVLVKPKALERIGALTRAARDMADTLEMCVSEEAFEPFPVDRILSDGERIDLGDGAAVTVMATPGHTRDCLSYYLEPQRAMFVSEAAGIPDQVGDIICGCLVDYDLFMASLEKIRSQPIDFLCLGHRGVFTGTDAAAHLKSAKERCEGFYKETASFFQAYHGDAKAVMARIRKTEFDAKPDPKQPEPAYLLNLEARVEAVRRAMVRKGHAPGSDAGGRPIQDR